jgi:hypothetical protein
LVAPGSPAATSRPRRGVVLAALLALTVGVFVARLGSIDYLLPHDAEPDAQMVTQAREFRTGVVEVPFARSTYPHLLPRILALLPLVESTAPADEAHLDEHLRTAARPYVEARVLVLLLSVLLVPVTYALARTWLGVPASLFAAALIATSLLHTCFSQQARPHGPFATLAGLCLLAALRLRRDGRTGSYAAFGGALAAAIGVLHTAVLLMPIGPIALVLRAKSSARPTLAKIALPVAMGAVAGLLFWPFLFEPERPGTWTAGESYRFPHQMENAWTGLVGLARPPLQLWRNEPVIAVLAVLGLVVVAIRPLLGTARAEGSLAAAVLVTAFVVPYVLFVSARTVAYPRFLLPVLAPLAVLAAVPFDALVRALKGRVRLVAGASVALVLLALPTYASGRMLWLRSRPDAVEIAAARVRELGPAPSLHVASQLAAIPPLMLDPDEATIGIGRNFPQSNLWLLYLVRLRDRGVALEGSSFRLIQREGRLPVSSAPTQAERIDFFYLLLEPPADAYLFVQVSSVGQRRAITEAMGAIARESVWIPEEPPFGWVNDSGHQGDRMLARVLARRVWGTPVELHTGLQFARDDAPRRPPAARPQSSGGTR